MKPIIKTSLIALTSAVIGAGATAGAIKYTDHKVNSPVAATDSPQNVFNEILKRHHLLNESFFNDPFKFHDPFKDDGFFKNEISLKTKSVINDIEQREDADNVYYDIKLTDPNSTSINTDIKDGQLTISGTTEIKDESESSQSISKSSFQRSFPLPENVDQNKMLMTTEKDKVVLKFPKLKV